MHLLLNSCDSMHLVLNSCDSMHLVLNSCDSMHYSDMQQNGFSAHTNTADAHLTL